MSNHPSSKHTTADHEWGRGGGWERERERENHMAYTLYVHVYRYSNIHAYPLSWYTYMHVHTPIHIVCTCTYMYNILCTYSNVRNVCTCIYISLGGTVALCLSQVWRYIVHYTSVMQGLFWGEPDRVRSALSSWSRWGSKSHRLWLEAKS